MLNQNVLNTEIIDGAINTQITGGGKLISVDQNVAIRGIGTFISVDQNVVLLQKGSGTIINIDQNVKAIGVGTIIPINQNVQLTNTYLSRNHYDCDIYINGLLLPKSEICGDVTIQVSEGAAASCHFETIPPLGVQTPESYQGKPVFVNLTNSSGVVHRAFTGFVDNPSMDIIQKKISFSCTDRRDTRILALPYGFVSLVGLYSLDAFGPPKDQSDEFTKRLSTVPYSFDFDNYGNASLTAWAPKASADFVLAGDAIYYEKPNVSYVSHDKVINTVNVTISYKHQRLHQQLAVVNWSGYNNFLTDWFNQGTPSFPNRNTIVSAAKTHSWAPVIPIQFVSLWPAGGYGSVQWQPNTVTNTYAARTITIPMISGGKTYEVGSFVLDVNGNKIYDITSTTITDTSSVLCRGAIWTAGTKFAQNVTELYSLRITSPQAINRYGIIDSHETININDPYDTAVWTGNQTLYTTNSGTPGTIANSVTDSAGYAKGATSITLTAVGSGALFTNNLITITGDTSGGYYRIIGGISNAGAGGTITIAQPGLGAPLLAQSYAINLAPSALSTNENFFIDQKPLYNRLPITLQTVYAKAQTTMLAASRTASVNFKRSIWPELNITHTVQTTATQIACKGKVKTYSHTIDCKTGEAYTNVSLLLSRSFGGDTATPYAVQTPPYEDTSYIGAPLIIPLGTRYGINPDPLVTPGAEAWNGFIGNATVSSGALGNLRSKYQEAFIVDYPQIPTTLRGDRTVTANTPGVNSGVTTNSAGYLAGASSIILATGGIGKILQGDSVTITGDASLQVYIVQTDILDVSSGGILSISPGLGSGLTMATHAVITSPAANNFVVVIPNDSLTVTF